MITNKSSYKRYAPYIILGVISISFLLILRAYRPHELKTSLSLRFKELFSNTPTVEIAGFDEGENWKGNYTRDSMQTFDGETGVNLFSTQNKPNTVSLYKSFDLSPYKTIFAYIYLKNELIFQRVESLTVGFQSKDKDKTSYTIHDLKKGWSLIAMDKEDFKNKDFDWKKIDSTTLELVSKKGETVQLTFDRIWAQNPNSDSKLFLSYMSQFVNHKTIGKSTFLHLASPKSTNLVLRKLIEKNDFSYTVTFAPLKLGSFGLSFLTDPQLENGYFFTLNGKQMNQWQLTKKTKKNIAILAEGELKNNTLEKQAYLWLRVEKRGEKITPSISLDGQNYLSIQEYKDSAFSKGYLGVLYEGSFLVDSIEVKE
ncbi:hypothetical protein A2334_03350 [Candidatus Roizmanbacteria bacterium RIFOXYB2_FULL_38_10]|uniref:Uncharacterized protein n=1 Tax=Candidatus Roizmanbacteria bacterium RIFOXYD1_FULL_38_12 TaxID=1802093 RepID=A0A1F7L106_9BACT|nr:MAG: hypothetical protein A3K47_03495 [Candidatus Roizmanbacteria bacterium RIFOXYA2_FULL_38_14]OGK63827.1 MAG: hypothetical protein A3K27_03495 [Candidatus Roizmanbacteria bacterium RIFOXYA1_FULL_37_12]OGK65673.1 MAG: hypothetical protein A3K38_03495 [Candidatus Roizmanbacteria bacterium RIFOXYB1_FULL_40_23]OGK67439.1 MAG: hypothetical protein A2334_03350 [Candidatus Roizmanbacteria bacterium RIFOXYB2_FULL_38_10]OGK70078.1 MAG: hypothetical protein A3K21_03500 [Candidatus Roizmanbacteria ba